MSTLLTSHLEQISLCATSISDLPFPGPKIFANALLSPNHDITALLRDTEQHERALFHLAPPSLPKNNPTADVSSLAATASNLGAGGGAGGRRATRYEPRPPRNRAVAAVLGGDLYQQTRNSAGGGGRQKGEVDVEVLLRGAEKLIAVYPIAGATEKIAQLRRRHQQLAANVQHYENRVAEQTRELQAMNRPTSRDDNDDGAEGQQDEEAGGDVTTSIPFTKEDLAREEEEIRELERKKKGLEDRVEGMERDLGGLMR